MSPSHQRLFSQLYLLFIDSDLTAGKVLRVKRPRTAMQRYHLAIKNRHFHLTGLLARFTLCLASKCQWLPPTGITGSNWVSKQWCDKTQSNTTTFVSQLLSVFWLHVFWNRSFQDQWHRFSIDQTTFLSPNQPWQNYWRRHKALITTRVTYPQSLSFLWPLGDKVSKVTMGIHTILISKGLR